MDNVHPSSLVTRNSSSEKETLFTKIHPRRGYQTKLKMFVTGILHHIILARILNVFIKNFRHYVLDITWSTSQAPHPHLG